MQHRERRYQCYAYKVGKPYGYPDGALSVPAPFQPHVLEKADKHWCNWNTESGGNSSHSDRERALVHPLQSHGAVLSVHAGPHRLLCVALFPSLSHQNYIIDSEGRVMFNHINGFLCALKFRCAGISKWWPQVEEVLNNWYIHCQYNKLG